MSYPLPTDPTGLQPLPIFPSTSDRHLPSQNTGSSLEKKQEFNILEKLKQLRDNKKYCDITLHVRGTKLEAHKNILAAWSPYFAAKLYPNDSRIFKDSVIVDYDNAEVFADLLDFMYNGYVAPRETNFLQLLHLAVSFEMEMLKNYCEEFLRCNLHLGNFVSTYILSRKYRLSSLEEYIVGFLQLNLSDAVKQGEFLSMAAGRFNTFLMKGWMEQIKPEIKLFLIISWVGYDVQEREKYLVLLLGHIDWSSVANDFLLEISRTENFFTSHESSLYLLLQTLFSAGIGLGPYTESFPSLRQTHAHILNDVVTTSLLQVENDTYYQVTISVNSRPTSKDASINTDVNCKHFEEHEQTQKSELMQESELYNNTDDDDEGELQIQTNTDELDEFGKFIKNEMEVLKAKIADDESQIVINQMKNTRQTAETGNVGDPLVDTSGCHKPSGRSSRSSRRWTRSQSLKSPGKSSSFQETSASPDKQSKCFSVEGNDFLIEQEDLTDESDSESDKPSNLIKNNGETPNILKSQTGNRSVSRVKQRSLTANEHNGRRFTKLKNPPKIDKSLDNMGSPITCTYDDCSYTTRLRGRLNKHIQSVHESTLDLRCNICNFEAKEVRKFNSHMKTHMNGPPYVCDEPRCSYKCAKIGKLLVHRLKHTNERPFICDICKMSFRSNSTMATHKKTHTGRKDYECEICHTNFATKNTMIQHMVTHSNHRPYLCDLCGFATKFQSHLISHRRIHSGEVFYCQFPKCKYSTPKRSQLKSHMRSHLGIRDHFCTTCGKSFIERSHLYRHEKLHTNEKIKCDFCDYTTTRKDKLKDHIVRHHGDGTEPQVKKPRGQSKDNRQRKVKPEEVKSSETTSPLHITPPMLVKWDHGGYSMQQTPVPDSNYCVLRDQLTAGEQVTSVVSLAPNAIQEPLNNNEARLTDLPSNVTSQLDTHAVVGQQMALTSGTNSNMGLVAGQVDAVGSVAASSGLDVAMVTTQAGSYVMMPNAHPAVQPQPEYGGLGAFMALL